MARLPATTFDTSSMTLTATMRPRFTFQKGSSLASVRGDADDEGGRRPGRVLALPLFSTAEIMRKASAAVCVAMFSASFLLLASVYDSLPAELPVLRTSFASVTTAAPKSVFTAFRVPLMNLTHGLIAAVMLSHATDFDDAGSVAAGHDLDNPSRYRQTHSCVSVLTAAGCARRSFRLL